ncbi:MAG: ACT domain-containing protein [Acutalibacteraceae bacterium]
MKAVVAVIGKDTVGIVAEVSNICAACDANITEVTQSVLQDLFAMIMLVDIQKLNVPFAELAEKLEELGNKMNLKIHIMHEDIFNSMHKI